MQGKTVEHLVYNFGFVIPNTTNSWDQVIDADVGNVFPAEVLSGNLTVDTFFLQGEDCFAKTKYRIFYVW